LIICIGIILAIFLSVWLVNNGKMIGTFKIYIPLMLSSGIILTAFLSVWSIEQ